jgi:class 3 adenylate cyclase/tetratricopeptide (TPR) repeat protein
MREQRKVVTILFCDLVGSTALGESTDPEALRARMQRYFDDLRVIVERHGGRVEKFVGDAVMAVFGVPVAHEDDALRALRAAVEMRTAVAEHGLEARIGVNTGEVVVGGESEILVTGDAVNVAARLEQAASSGEILIGAGTHALARDAASAQALEPLVLKGKSEPVEGFRLLAVVGHEPVARRLETPLVGRERERGRLWRDFEDAVADDACRLFTLLGPAGIGKSRLVADFIERIGDSADVLRGRCLSYGEGITYWPLVEMFAPIGVDPKDVVASTPQETRVAFRRLLEERAVERPQVVVVDDLQWAEPLFVDLVEHVADLSRGAPIFLLCIARTELLEARPDWGGGKLNATSLLLEPLAADERELLIDTLLGTASIEGELRDRIVEVSAGYPLYVEEMLAIVREQDGREVNVPPTIQALIQARIDSLAPEVRVVLERAAIEGEVFHRDTVEALVPKDVRVGVDEYLASLIRKELIWPDRELGLEEAYRFRHILVREVVYGSMPKALRADLHERFAGRLERADVAGAFEQDEILGYHLEQALLFHRELGADDPELAARAAVRLYAAGQNAFARADLPAAYGFLQRAVDLGGDDRMHLQAMFALAQVLARRGELERAGALLPDVVEAARAVGDQSLLAQARLAHNTLRIRMDSEATVEGELEEAVAILASLEGSGAPAALVTAYAEIGTCKFQLGRAGEGEDDLARAFEIALTTGDSTLLRDTMGARLRPAGWGPMPAPQGITLVEEVLAADYANATLRASALQILALFLAMRGDFDESRRAADDAWTLIEEYDLRLLEGIYSGDVGSAELIARDLERAERVLRRGHEALLEMGDVGVRSTTDGVLSDVLFLQGRHDEALALADGSGAIAAPDDLDSQPRWRAARARVLASRGETDEALELLDEARKLVEPIDFVELKAYVHEVHGEALARAGRTEDAAVAMEQAVAFYEQKGNVVSSGRLRTTLAELRMAVPPS